MDGVQVYGLESYKRLLGNPNYRNDLAYHVNWLERVRVLGDGTRELLRELALLAQPHDTHLAERLAALGADNVKSLSPPPRRRASLSGACDWAWGVVSRVTNFLKAKN